MNPLYFAKNPHKMQYDIEINGYKLYLKSKGLNYFTKQIGTKYAEIICSDRQLTNGDIEFMTQTGITLDKGRQKEIESQYQF